MANSKKRPRAHIIADLSVNYLERFFLYEGHMVDRPVAGNDYGLDLSILTFNDRHELENGWIYVQLKATDKIEKTKNGRMLRIKIRKADLNYWVKEVNPVILIVYDATKEEAFWLNVQKYFESIAKLRVGKATQSSTMFVPLTNIVSRESVQQIVNEKREQFAAIYDLKNKIRRK